MAETYMKGRSARDGSHQVVVLPLVLVLLCISFLDALAVGIILPHIRDLCRPPGTGWGFAAAIESVYALFQLFGGPAFGAASDSHSVGRKLALQIAAIGSAAAYGILGLWSGLFAVICCRVLAGLFKHGGPVIIATIADLTASGVLSKTDSLKVISRVGLAKSFGSIIGPLLGGYLAPHQAGSVAGSIFVMSFLATTFAVVQPDQPVAKKSVDEYNATTPIASYLHKFYKGVVVPWKDVLQVSGLKPLVVLWGLLAMGLSLFRGSLRPFIELGAGINDRVSIGWFQSLLHVAEALSGMLIERLAIYINNNETIALRTACWVAAASIVAAALSTTSTQVLCALFPFYAALGVARICYKALVSVEIATCEVKVGRGSIHGVVDSIMTAGRLIGPTCAGLLIDVTNQPAAPLWISFLLFCVAQQYIQLFIPSRKKND